jgi:hypothetical protein
VKPPKGKHQGREFRLSRWGIQFSLGLFRFSNGLFRLSNGLFQFSKGLFGFSNGCFGFSSGKTGFSERFFAIFEGFFDFSGGGRRFLAKRRGKNAFLWRIWALLFFVGRPLAFRPVRGPAQLIDKHAAQLHLFIPGMVNDVIGFTVGTADN